MHRYVTNKQDKFNLTISFMKKTLLNSVAIALAASVYAPVMAQTPTPNLHRVLVECRTYGTPMGDMPKTVDSRRDFYFYNNAGYTIGFASYGRTYNDPVSGGGTSDGTVSGDSKYTNYFSLADIIKYRFNENDLPTNKDTYQRDDFESNVYTWKKTVNCESYSYNEKGQLLADSTSYNYHTYTYNDDGTLASKSTYMKATKQCSQTITYSDYDANGNPWHYSSTGAYDSYKYEADLEYDDNGNKTEEYQYTFVDDKNNPGEKIQKSKQVENWTYENGVLTLYTCNSFDDKGVETPLYKTEYTPVDGNEYVIAVADSMYSAGKWYSNELPRRFYYRDFSDKQASTAMSIVSANADAQATNTVNIRFTMPQLAQTESCKFIVYRDCAPIDTLALADANVANGMGVYQDKEVQNGTYTYFIQPVFAASTSASDADYVGYFCTNPVDVTVGTVLPAVTDLTFVGGESKVTGNIGNLRKEYYANLTWKNPENAAQYGFLKNSIFFAGAGVAELDITDATVDKASVMLYDEDVKVYVVSSYKLGKAVSESIDVKFDEVSVGSVAVDGALSATFAGNTVKFSDAVNVSVFTVAGQQVCAKSGVSSVVLGDAANTYIICVEKNGVVKAYKYAVK